MELLWFEHNHIGQPSLCRCMNAKGLSFIRSSLRVDINFLPGGVQQTTEEEKEETQGHILL